MHAADAPSGAFAVRHGLARGLTRGTLRGPRFSSPVYGVREARTGRARPTPEEQRLAEFAPHLLAVRRLAASYAPRMRPDQFFSHDTALALLGVPTPDGWEACLHVSALRPRNGPTARAAIGHRLQQREPAWSFVRGLRIEHPVRAWVQASTVWMHDDLVAAADHLILPKHGLATLDELRAEASRMRRHALDDVLSDVREGSESFRETQLRLACMRAGLPEPELNVGIFAPSGELIARIDQLYRRQRVAVEYDGRQHASDQAQFERDADRWDAIRAAGWDHVRILRKHLVPDPSLAVAKIAAALARHSPLP